MAIPTISSKATPAELQRFARAVKLYIDSGGATALTIDQINARISQALSGFVAPASDATDLTPPGPPTNLVANGGFNTILLTWDGPGGAYGYEIARNSEDDLGNAVIVSPVTQADMWTDVPPDSAMATDYYYWVRAVSAANIRGPFNAAAGTLAHTASEPAFVLKTIEGEVVKSELYEELHSNLGGLSSQLTFKIDNNGFPAGFGLASEEVDGVPFSEFISIADRHAWINPAAAVLDISSMTYGAGIVTVNTAAVNDVSVDDYVVITGAEQGPYNGSHKVTQVVSTTSFRFTTTSSPASPATVMDGFPGLKCARAVMPLAIQDGQVVMGTALIVNLTAENFVGKKVVADEVVANISLTSPKIYGAELFIGDDATPVLSPTGGVIYDAIYGAPPADADATDYASMQADAQTRADAARDLAKAASDPLGSATAARNAAQTYADAAANAVKVIAKAYTDNEITSAEASIIASANQYANAAELAAVITANAHTDGVVSAVEQDAIDAANEYAHTQDLIYKATAEAYADGVATAAESAAISATQAYADLKKTEALAYADGIVTTAEAAAIAAAKAYSDAQDAVYKATAEAYANGVATAAESAAIASATAYSDLKKTEANAYADGIVTEAEQDAIDAAKAYSDAQDTASALIVKAYADGVATDAEAAAITSAQAYADAKKIEAAAYADGVATDAEAAAIAAANLYADAAEAAAATTAAAYADGIVTNEEARAIADATAKANAAEAAAKAHTEAWSEEGADSTAEAINAYTVTDSGGMKMVNTVNGDYIEMTPASIKAVDASNSANNLTWVNGTLTLPNACVDTLQIKGNAVTVPAVGIKGAAQAGTGSRDIVINVTIVLDQPGWVHASASAAITYGSGWRSARTEFWVAGTLVAAQEGAEGYYMTVAHSGAVYCAAGSHNATLYFEGADSGVRIEGSSVFVMGAKR